MAINKSKYQELKQELDQKNVQLVAVSKIQSPDDIYGFYQLGQRDFGENYVQELVDKQAQLPIDIQWHFIGHLQSNKVKFISPFVHLIHGVDRLKLLKEISKQAAKNGRIINCLLQVHVAKEETKFGLNEEELVNILAEVDQKPKDFANIMVTGLMGMASFSDDEEVVRGEFKFLKYLYDKYKSVVTPNCNFSTLSMGMSGDYKWAIEEGSTMVRIGSLLFGARVK
jgi:pyridoxal phosphate enzyme (YggS family)